jgi:hypothetical protein
VALADSGGAAVLGVEGGFGGGCFNRKLVRQVWQGMGCCRLRGEENEQISGGW